MTIKPKSPASRPLRIAFQTLGCPKNTVDSDSLASVLAASGFECVMQPHRADVLIVNTCGFLDDAKIEAVETLLAAVRWKAARAGRRVFAMGCLTQRDGDEISAEIPELDGIFGIGQWTAMLMALGANPVSATSGISRENSFTGSAGPSSIYLRISDGCSHACAFCSIPQMRGLYRSEPIEDLVCEAAFHVEHGVQEIILIGQETTSYGVDLYRERRLVELCRQLSELKGLRWIRLLYAHPPTTPPKLLEELAGIPHFASYIDFPIEHASERVLKLMNRRTSATRMKETIAAFRAARPDACIRTSVMVGFPGETDRDFEILLRFMEDVRFERAGAFIYSPQEGTSGANLPDPVEEGIALDRLDQLMRLQKRIMLERHRSLEGKVVDVLVERQVRNNAWGRTAWDAPEIDGRVRVAVPVAPGSFVHVQITKAYAYQLDSRLIADDAELMQREPCGKSSSSVCSPQ
ncbi:30S ribosomal protein S12 methylthiotransferase RimO [candidate division KSB1 bacterium]|nr:MAG: 30S ribosomal protein S12 methylthiotransferase RimO [candidate division KSB1 bacterium]